MLTDKFITRASDIHNGKFQYLIETSTVLVKDKVNVICNNHGTFLTRVHDHIYHKSGCPECAREAKTASKDFIKHSDERHKNKYDYSNVKYINQYTPVSIECPIHGMFSQQPMVHTRAVTGCPKCDVSNRSKTLNDFMLEAEKIHNYKYDYSKVKYVNVKEKVDIICKIHGSFWQTPENHIFNSAGCPNCAHMSRSTQHKLDTGNHSTLYLALFSSNDCDERFVKIGITTNDSITKRFRGISNYKIDSLYEEKMPISSASNIEKTVLTKFDTNKYQPRAKFGGYTECFELTSADSIIEFIRANKND